MENSKLVTLPAVTNDIGKMLHQLFYKKELIIGNDISALRFWHGKDVRFQGMMMKVVTFIRYFLCYLGQMKR